MDLASLLTTYWAPLAVAGGFVVSLVLLKYKHEALAVQVKELTTEVHELRDEMRQEVNDARSQADDNLRQYIEMEKEEHMIIISRTEAAVDRVSSRVDANFEKLSVKIDKLVDYQLNRVIG
jgi:outer membrane murein-binding lipoprotein Lpp